MTLILEILAYFSATPPPYDQALDLNKDGWINVLDFLLALSL